MQLKAKTMNNNNKNNSILINWLVKLSVLVIVFFALGLVCWCIFFAFTFIQKGF